MKYNKKRCYKGKKIYTFQGIDYLAWKDTGRSFGNCIKHTNGRYYMTLNGYEKGRRQYWKCFFQQKVYSLIWRMDVRSCKWRVLVNQVLHKERFVTLINSLRRTSFAKLLKHSELYSKVKESVLLRKTCSNCGSVDTQFEKGPCQSHLSEDWYDCSSRDTRCPDQLRC